MSLKPNPTLIKYTFKAEWFDPMAAMARPYLVSFFTNDNTIEIYDVKNKRVFLRRCPCGDATFDQFFIGNTVDIFARSFKLLDYADGFTRGSSIQERERSLLIVKPDIMQFFGRVVELIEKEDLRICRLRSFRLNRQETSEIFEEYSEHPKFEELVRFVSGQLVIGMEVVGKSCHSRIVELVGPDEPDEARISHPESLRAVLGKDWVRNGVYCTGSEESEKRADAILFGRSHGVTAMKNGSTFGLILPHVIREKKAGALLRDVLEEGGFDLSCAELFHLSNNNAYEFFKVYQGIWKDFSVKLEEVVSGPCIALELKGNDVQQSFRSLCGPHDPTIAKVLAPKSLRAKYGRDRVHNGIHCTDLEDDTFIECEFFFDTLQE
ncbi:putative Nucleoside diphosphate kinase 7 [Blattamonas nauphoetae]|uniref:Nucleoside diphosphate kinase 7 n=1 Tax=Blattamonas nauphoetae TaxID=2049346 RepID=A0ABQ9WZT9_9EUKA|nr:putative Nucleoside diphosphate kinase 7 [Blattamonas nauphoetae]KAK2945038.1 putative Nucleoside diphosphate kinase 7 [Blattamonas nauphoetae]